MLNKIGFASNIPATQKVSFKARPEDITEEKLKQLLPDEEKAIEQAFRQEGDEKRKTLRQISKYRFACQLKKIFSNLQKRLPHIKGAPDNYAYRLGDSEQKIPDSLKEAPLIIPNIEDKEIEDPNFTMTSFHNFLCSEELALGNNGEKVTNVSIAIESLKEMGLEKPDTIEISKKKD